MELIPHVVFLLLLSIVESKKFGQLGPIVAHERNLHRDVCLGLWVNGVHNQGICILDVQNRMTCEEVNYLFRQQNHKYRPLPLEKVPKLVMKRALQEHALKNNKKTVLCANVDETFKSPENHCPPGFYPHRNQCYGVSTRKVHFPVAETICKQLGGQLANEFEDADVLVDLVKNYVQEDVFTGFNHVENLDNVEQTRSIEHAHVVVDYRAGELEYVVQNARRGFICQSRKRLLELPQPAMLPSYADDVKVHDLHPLQSEIKLDRHLVDLMSFHCYGAIDKNGNYKDYELAVTDLVENPPSGCTFKKSLGKVYVDIDNTHVLPSDLKHACKHLVPLYRVYDHVKARYFFFVRKAVEVLADHL
ncbi:hypothetical protein M3Y94_01102200 [Aphelenchoides besseyi]|nr:hypothetical protein M3Y94_01102200 [Aphelenchoides besseyi]